MGIDLPTIEAIKRFVAMATGGSGAAPDVARELEIGELVRVTVDELEMKRVLRLVHAGRPRSPMPERPFCAPCGLCPGEGPPFYYHLERTS